MRSIAHVLASLFLFAGLILPRDARGVLLAHEPFTNSSGAPIIGSAGGTGFGQPWQNNSSTGVATNTDFGLGYTDSSTNALVTTGGAAFFQGSTSGSAAMQPVRPFNFARGTNGTDGTTTWISFLIARLGPTGTLTGNPYGRGANIPHDLGTAQKLAIGNSSGAATNTVGLIPQGAGGNLKSSTTPFGGATNFVVVRIDHVSGAAHDNAWLFVNPDLDTEPSTNSAGAVSLDAFDFSFNQLRVFAGGQSSSAQPYAELILDEYRVGESYADVAPHLPFTPTPPPGPLVITNAWLVDDGIVLAGVGGPSNAVYSVLAASDLANSSSNWPAIATNTFDANGHFVSTNPINSGAPARYFRLFVADQTPPPPVAPTITSHPTNLSVVAGQPATFNATATGTEPLAYQWLFNTNTPLSGASGSSYTIASVQAANAGAYALRVSNAAGAVTSQVAILTVLQPPAITAQPANLSVIVSNNASFSVTATGTVPLRYQWFFNTNTPLANAPTATFNLPVVQLTNAGLYSVRITNHYGAITSTFAALTVTTQALTANYYVATNGSDSNAGTNINAPFATLAKAASVANPGNLIYVRGGTYNWSTQVGLSRSGTPAQPIRVFAYPGESPVFNFSGQGTGTRGISISGNCWHLKGFEIAHAGDNGIYITGKTNTIELCVLHDNEDSGIQLANAGAAYNLILNCDSYRNFDFTTDGENADGFAAKFDLGPGNVFSGCRAWENSDDGWDLWQATNSVVLTNCWTWRNGSNAWAIANFAGDGNGIKLGGNYYFGRHYVYNCIAFKNPGHGFDQNNNNSGQTLFNNTGWANGGRNFYLSHGTNITPHVLCNNLSIAGGSADNFYTGTLATNNSWQVISPAANTSDVLSILEALVLAPRQPDGSLPVTDFLRPKSPGRLVDAGVDAGLPFNGAAPDLGAFETGP